VSRLPRLGSAARSAFLLPPALAAFLASCAGTRGADGPPGADAVRSLVLGRPDAAPLRESGSAPALPPWIILAILAVLALAAVLVAWRGGRILRSRASPGLREADGESGDSPAPAPPSPDAAATLAGQGRYGEASIELFRSCALILGGEDGEAATAALTRRELAARVPTGLRAAYELLADSAERSLFGGRQLAPGDWEATLAAFRTLEEGLR